MALTETKKTPTNILRQQLWKGWVKVSKFSKLLFLGRQKRCAFLSLAAGGWICGKKFGGCMKKLPGTDSYDLLY